MLLDIFILYFLHVLLPEVHMLEPIETVFDDGLERRVRRDGGLYDYRPPSCDQKFHTENSPYVAVILSRTSGNFLCMGSILGPRTVLTVRECLMRDDINDLLVMGGYMSAWWGKNAQVKYVQEIVKSDFDLAILKLTKKFIFSRTVRPIRLSHQAVTVAHTSYGNVYGIVGFVRAPWDVPGEPMPKNAFYEIKYATLMAGSDKKTCTDIYKDVPVNDTTMFCTYANTTYCWGNLGSPTVVLLREQVVQMGIVVRAYCDEKYNPNLHMRIDAFEGWIRSHSEARMK